MYKIKTLENFSYMDNGVDRGQGVRDKARELVELLSDPNKLQYEREYARQTREKLTGTSGSHQEYSGPSVGGSAAPASGSQKYGGFGSEDIQKLGYNNSGQFGNTGPYDPYTKGQSAPSVPT